MLQLLLLLLLAAFVGNSISWLRQRLTSTGNRKALHTTTQPSTPSLEASQKMLCDARATFALAKGSAAKAQGLGVFFGFLISHYAANNKDEDNNWLGLSWLGLAMRSP